MSLQGKASANEVLKGRINRCNEIVINAYQIAVKNGFDGTEKEWLESLKPDSFVYTLSEGETIDDAPDNADVVIDPYAKEGASPVTGIYTLAEGETIEDAPADADVVIDPYADEPDIPLTREDIPEIVDEVLSKLPTWTGGSF